MLISDIQEIPMVQYCSKCGEKPYMESVKELQKKRAMLQEQVRGCIDLVPIITIPSPLNWSYKILGMVTGQSTTGTGIFSEFKSGWADIFGLQSSAYNEKIAAGEQLCSRQLRAKTISIGGNAVIAADIDYSELGGDKGMIMVCMSGTAVKIENLDVLPTESSDRLKEIDGLKRELIQIEEKYPDSIRRFANG